MRESPWRAPLSGISFSCSESTALCNASQTSFTLSFDKGEKKIKVFKEPLADLGAEGVGSRFGEGLLCTEKHALSLWDACSS